MRVVNFERIFIQLHLRFDLKILIFEQKNDPKCRSLFIIYWNGLKLMNVGRNRPTLVSWWSRLVKLETGQCRLVGLDRIKEREEGEREKETTPHHSTDRYDSIQRLFRIVRPFNSGGRGPRPGLLASWMDPVVCS